MRVSVAETYFVGNVLHNLFNISQTMTREQSVTPSIQTLCDFIDFGIKWWAPIPDTRYKSQDGRDLNLKVICTIMVSNYPDNTTLSSLNYPFCIRSYLFSSARLNIGHKIHLIRSTRICQNSRPLTIPTKRNIHGEMTTKVRYMTSIPNVLNKRK
jgi:hypothetical protein